MKLGKIMSRGARSKSQGRFASLLFLVCVILQTSDDQPTKTL